MSDQRGHGPFGTVYFPEPDTVAVQAGDGRARPSPLMPLPRRRRPMMIVAAALLIGLGILISVALYQRVNREVQVLVVQRDVAAGSVITAADLGTASIAATGVSDIPAQQRNEVIGLVAVSMRPSALLASGVAVGDHVTLIATPGVIGENSSAGSPNNSLITPVAGVVQAVDATPNQDGEVVVDVLVPTGAGAAVLQQDSTGQIGLIVTKQAAP